MPNLLDIVLLSHKSPQSEVSPQFFKCVQMSLCVNPKKEMLVIPPNVVTVIREQGMKYISVNTAPK